MGFAQPLLVWQHAQQRLVVGRDGGQLQSSTWSGNWRPAGWPCWAPRPRWASRATSPTGSAALPAAHRQRRAPL